MSPNLAPILHFVERLCKQDTVACPLCGLSEKCPKTGFYKRYDPGTGRRIRIQRHLCRNPECPAVTFSVLPPPLLPLFGMTWTMLLLAMMLRPHFSVNALACLFECCQGSRYIPPLGPRKIHPFKALGGVYEYS